MLSVTDIGHAGTTFNFDMHWLRKDNTKYNQVSSSSFLDIVQTNCDQIKIKKYYKYGKYNEVHMFYLKDTLTVKPKYTAASGSLVSEGRQHSSKYYLMAKVLPHY